MQISDNCIILSISATASLNFSPLVRDTLRRLHPIGKKAQRKRQKNWTPPPHTEDLAFLLLVLMHIGGRQEIFNHWE